MLIAIGPLGHMTDFLQVLCWIILPVLLLILLFTTLHHYARKRRNAADALAEEEMTRLIQPGNNGEAAYLMFDHTGVIRDYKNKLSYSTARYTALKKDFEKLERRYQQVTDRENEKQLNPQILYMETTHEPTQQVARPVASEELFLKDLVEEKKAEVAFLQSQLEQRVRKQHETELEKETLRTELQEQLSEKDHLLRSKDEQIATFEARYSELKQQNELLNAAVADGNDRFSLLQNQLEEERTSVTAMKQKLQANKQLLQRLYKEFTDCMDESGETPAVVPMQPAYLNSIAADY